MFSIVFIEINPDTKTNKVCLSIAPVPHTCALLGPRAPPQQTFLQGLQHHLKCVMLLSRSLRGAAQRLPVFVASENRVKVQAVHIALQQACPRLAFDVQGVTAQIPRACTGLRSTQVSRKHLSCAWLSGTPKQHHLQCVCRQDQCCQLQCTAAQQTWRSAGVAVPSGVPEQPWADRETLQGCAACCKCT